MPDSLDLICIPSAVGSGVRSDTRSAMRLEVNMSSGSSQLSIDDFYANTTSSPRITEKDLFVCLKTLLHCLYENNGTLQASNSFGYVDKLSKIFEG